MKFENLLPVFAPTPAGLVIAIRLYQEILAALGFTNTAWQFIAGAGALIGCVGMIGAEMYAYKQAGIALAERQIGAAIAAFFAAVVCSALIIWAIGTSPNARPLISAVVVAIAGYVVLAIRDFIGRKNAVKQEQRQTQAQSMEYTLRAKELDAKIAAAEARKAKAEHEQPRSAVRTNKPNSRTAEQLSKLEAVRQAMAELQTAGEKITTRAVAAKTGMSNSTASGYMAEIGAQK